MSALFDPVFIMYQIIAMQCFYYLAMGTLWGLCHVIFDTPVSLDHFFTAKYINFVSISGWIEVSCTLIMAIIGYVYIQFNNTYYYLYIILLNNRANLLSVIVERSKKCVDFTFTLFFLHTVYCMIYLVCTFYIQSL